MVKDTASWSHTHATGVVNTPLWFSGSTSIDADNIEAGIYSQKITASNLNKNNTWYSCFDRAIASAKKNNTFTRAYNVAGVKIKCEEEFENSTQKMRLHFYGKDKILDKEISFDETININTDIYNRYDWAVKNGVLYVILYEKINLRPDFKRIEKESKKADSKEDKNNGKEM